LIAHDILNIELPYCRKRVIRFMFGSR